MHENIKIVEANDSSGISWNNFVKSNINGSFYHLFEWKNIFMETYGFKSFYFQLYDVNNELVGLIPFTKLKTIFFSDYFISLPFVPYAGLLVTEGYKIEYPEIIDLLNWQNKFVKLRIVANDIPSDNDYVTLTLDLPDSTELLWSDFKDKVRNLIRKSEKNNLSFKSGKEYLSDFINVYYRNMKLLGTPIHKFNFYLNIIKYFPENCNVWVVKKNENVIGGMISFIWNKCTYNYIASTLVNYNNIAANMFLYWNALCMSIESGCNKFDFGRSKFGSSTFNFKKQWGAYPRKLLYINYKNGSIEKGRIPEQNMFLTKIWSSIPDLITKHAGVRLRKFIP